MTFYIIPILFPIKRKSCITFISKRYSQCLYKLFCLVPEPLIIRDDPLVTIPFPFLSYFLLLSWNKSLVTSILRRQGLT